jgi:hypothetical protein
MNLHIVVRQIEAGKLSGEALSASERQEVIDYLKALRDEGWVAAWDYSLEDICTELEQLNARSE